MYTKIVLNVRNNFCTQHVLPRFELGTCNSMNNLSSYCGLADAKITASDKDLPVLGRYNFGCCILCNNATQGSDVHEAISQLCVDV